MWWIRTRAKVIIPVLLVVAVIVGAAVMLSGKTTSTSAVNKGDEATGVRVITDKDGKIVVTGRDPSEVKLSLALPQNCAQISVFMDGVLAAYPGTQGATDEVRVHVTIVQRLAQDLCSWREYNALSSNQFTSWYKDATVSPDATAPTTVTGSDNTTGATLPTDTSVVDPAGTSTIPTDAASTTVTGG